VTQRRKTQRHHPSPAPEEEAQLSDHIKNHELSELFAKVEDIKRADTGNPMVKSSRPLASVAASVVTLMIEVKQEAGRYPDAFEIVAATNDRVFAGLKQLSWGLLTSSSRRDTFKAKLLWQIKRTTPPPVESSASAHNRQLEEQKRDTMMEGRWCDLPDPDPADDNQPELKSFMSALND
jgi:hypothetical protein